MSRNLWTCPHRPATMGTIPDGAYRKLERLPLVSFMVSTSPVITWVEPMLKLNQDRKYDTPETSNRPEFLGPPVLSNLQLRKKTHMEIQKTYVAWVIKTNHHPSVLIYIIHLLFVEIRWFQHVSATKTPSETAWTVQLSLPKGRTCDWPAICAGMASMHHHMPCRLKGWKVHKIRGVIPNCVTDKGVSAHTRSCCSCENLSSFLRTDSWDRIFLGLATRCYQVWVNPLVAPKFKLRLRRAFHIGLFHIHLANFRNTSPRCLASTRLLLPVP